MIRQHSSFCRILQGLLIGTAAVSPSFAGEPVNTIVVTTTNDGLDAFDQQCSLREAIANANTNTAYSPVVDECPAGSGSDTDSIVLSAGATYLLTSSDVDDGDLDIVDDPELPVAVRDLRIGTDNPDGAYTIVEQQVAGERVLQIAGADVTLSRVMLRGGATADVGGGIFNEGGALVLDHVILHDNTAVTGGGLYNTGDAQLISTNATSNTADLIGGGIFHDEGAGTLRFSNGLVGGNEAASGGGIYSLDDVLLEDSEVSDNLASGNGAGILVSGIGHVELNGATVAGNKAQGSGGGVHIDNGNDVNSVATDFIGNEAGVDGGAIHGVNDSDARVEDGRFSDNLAQGDGGAIYASRITSHSVTFEGNTASGQGGATWSDLSTNVHDSRFTGNSATAGGASYARLINVFDSRVEGNNANESGGGFYAWSLAIIHDSIIASNSAGLDGGGLWIDSNNQSHVTRSVFHSNVAQNDGGGMFVNASDTTLLVTNTTLSGNAAMIGSGSGLYIDEGATVNAVNVTLANNAPGENLAKYGDLTLQNSIITTPNGIDCVAILDNPEIDSLGSNLSDDDSCIGLDFADDLTNVDVLLAPLAANGGNTMTHALLAGSPAIDRGNNAACDEEPVGGLDQRGGARDIGLNCDIGAHEQGAVVSFALFGDGFE